MTLDIKNLPFMALLKEPSPSVAGFLEKVKKLPFIPLLKEHPFWTATAVFVFFEVFCISSDFLAEAHGGLWAQGLSIYGIACYLIYSVYVWFGGLERKCASLAPEERGLKPLYIGAFSYPFISWQTQLLVRFGPLPDNAYDPARVRIYKHFLVVSTYVAKWILKVEDIEFIEITRKQEMFRSDMTITLYHKNPRIPYPLIILWNAVGAQDINSPTIQRLLQTFQRLNLKVVEE